MSDLNELLAQKAELEKRIEAAQKQARGDAINKIKTLMTEYGLTLADLNPKAPVRTTSAKGSKVAPKFRDAVTGDTWSGRGLQPKWLKAALASGRKIEDFAV